MADALLGVVTESLLTKVTSLANDRISGVLGVKEDLQKLAKQLELIQALLSDAQSKSTTNKIIEVWLQELEETAADADDLLDEFAYQVLCKKMLKGIKDEVRSFLSSSNPLVSRFKMASKIKKINLQMNEIFKKANLIGLRLTEIINSPTDPRRVLTDPFVDDSNIIGRGDDVSKIVSLLTHPKDEKDRSVIGIVGMGGQGKTMLAKLLMKNDQVKKHFEKTAWTCVSDDFNVDRVLNDMLQSLTKSASHSTNREVIVEELSKELKGKRFLLVLDDVWNKDSQLGDLWDTMNSCLQATGGSKGSQIIVTTRDEGVVNVMKGFVYHLGVLSEKASQELFEKIVFENGRGTKTPQLVQIGEKIVARCGGVPLALKAIGGLLSSRRDELEWQKIEESSIWSTLDGVFSAIKLSFDHLSSLSLKQCFAYCSVFPKDSVIKKNPTIQQWMAHGLLSPSSGSGLEMEDVGNNYFNILLQRSLLQEAEYDMYGNIVSCKLHDLVHDFALTISKGRCLTAKVGELRNDIKAVHLSIVPDESNDLNISEKIFSRLRTLHLLDGFSNENFLAHCKCEHLRVLTLDDRGMKELPISIAKMKHLRYLDISSTYIFAIPEFISRLHNLQTLKLPFVHNLPKDLVRSVKLRHLDIQVSNSLLYVLHGTIQRPLFSGVGQLTFLRTLNYFLVTRDEGCQIKELCSLNHLEGSLTIVGLENVTSEDDAKRANLSEKRNIERLRLYWGRNNTEGSSNDESVLEGLQPHSYLKALTISYFMGKSLPSWIPRLHNLVKMKLENLVNCEQIPPLGHLPFLKILHMVNMYSIKYVGNDFYGCQTSLVMPVVFPSLQELSFCGMPSLEEWSDMVQPSYVSSSSFSVELFPCLESLDIQCCSSLTRLPEGLLCAFTSLESLRIRSCDNLVCIPNLISFHSLKELDIYFCEQFSALPPGIEACRSLQRLTLSCPASVMKSLPNYLTHLRKLTVFLSNDIIEPVSNSTEDDIQGHDDPFPPLECLALIGLPENKSLPKQIQRFTALRALELSQFGGLETLPEWLGNFHSLESLSLNSCPFLANFPSEEAMRGLTNLKSLSIFKCPILKERCKRETGAEWHKIAHIPEIDINKF